MSTERPYDLHVKRDLGNGLLLRWSEANDTEEIVYLTSMVFRDADDEPPNTHAGNLARELMSGRHPSMGPRDFVVVEDTRRPEHRIVACTCFWSQTWEYEGIRFGFGRPEIVATDSAYRHRGLVRALFDSVMVQDQHLVAVRPRPEFQPYLTLAQTEDPPLPTGTTGLSQSTNGRARGDSNPRSRP